MQTLTIETGEIFTIKHDGTTTHITGITTATGRQVCSALADRSLQTGHTFESLADAVAEMNAVHRYACRVCSVASSLILNR